MQLQFKNLDKKSRTERKEIRESAGKLQTELTKETYFK